MKTNELIKQIRNTEDDFEWYPTTNEIISALISDYELGPIGLDEEFRECWRTPRDSGILDIGAGNGKVLMALKEAGFPGSFYAIEKSAPLLASIPDPCVIVGTDFWEQSLYDKRMNVTFCNPPYSSFESWAERIIVEIGSPLLYLVIPTRWQESARIASAIKARSGKFRIVGEFDFEKAERSARAKVHLIRIELDNDAFDHFFDLQFGELVREFEEETLRKQTQRNAREENLNALISRIDMVSALVQSYQADLANVRKSYLALCQVDVSVLTELRVTIESIKERLLARLSGLKTEYWKRVFDNLDKLTARLTHSNREKLMHRISEHSDIDFTLGNVYAIVLWAIEHSNRFIEDQFIDTYSRMVDEANVFTYKSNHKVFVKDRWRYDPKTNSSTHFGLNYRIIVSIGGIVNSSYSWDRTQFDGLDERAHWLLCDLFTIANNMGFECRETPRSGGEWSSGRKKVFHYEPRDGGPTKVLMDVKAYKLGTLHIRLANEFALALNVEWGRLRGWVRSPAEASREMDAPDAKQHWRCYKPITMESAKNLLPTTEEIDGEETTGEPGYCDFCGATISIDDYICNTCEESDL